MFFKQIQTRRSIRKFTNQPVERQTIDRLIEAALRAPSSRDFRPWRFIVVDQPDLLEKLADAKPHGMPVTCGWKTAPLHPPSYTWQPMIWAWDPAGYRSANGTAHRIKPPKLISKICWIYRITWRWNPLLPSVTRMKPNPGIQKPLWHMTRCFSIILGKPGLKPLQPLPGRYFRKISQICFGPGNIKPVGCGQLFCHKPGHGRL